MQPRIFNTEITVDCVRQFLGAKFFQLEEHGRNLFRGFLNLNDLEKHRIVKRIAQENVNCRRTRDLVLEMENQLHEILDGRTLINPHVLNPHPWDNPQTSDKEHLGRKDAALLALYRTGILQAEWDDTLDRDVLIFPTPLHERYVKHRPSIRLCNR